MKGKRIPKSRPRRQPRRDDAEPVSASFIDSCAHMELPSLAIVGRPNVGKSSLFNAILGRRQAIVHFDCGVTRDRVSASGVWQGRRFNLIDTGGLGMFENETNSVGKWDKLIAEQVAAAIEDAAAILFVVDVQAGLLPLDHGIADRLRACGKPVYLIANKADNREDALLADDFHTLGFEHIHPVSCLHKRGIEDVLEDALSGIEPSDAELAAHVLKIAVLGRPNVGKSSLVNRLIGKDRVIVSDVAGTTRDSIDVEFELKCSDSETVRAVLVDTAGLRKKSKVDGAVEQYSMMRAQHSLDTCDIVLFVVEADKGEATSQDKTIARMIEESGKGCILVVNKWDIRPEKMPREELIREFRASLPKMSYAPLVFVSALTGENLGTLFDLIAQVRAQLSARISTAMLNRVIQDATTRTAPPVVGLKPLKIYYGTMTETAPPHFILFINKRDYCADSYKAYLSNYFRNAFNLVGVPIRIVLQERDRRDLSEVVNHAGSSSNAKKKFANAKQAKTAKKKSSFKKEVAAQNKRRAGQD